MEEQLTRRERKKQETRLRLIQCAQRLFAEQGYDQTTVAAITEAADVAKGTFFNYFEVKEAILPAIADWRLQQLSDILSPEQGGPEDPIDRVKLILELVAEEALSDPALTRRMFAAKHCEPESHPVKALTMLLAQQVEEAQATGQIRADVAPIFLGGVIRALLFQQAIMYHRGYRPTHLAQLLSDTVDLLLDGVGGPNWRNHQ